MDAMDVLEMPYSSVVLEDGVDEKAIDAAAKQLRLQLAGSWEGGSLQERFFLAADGMTEMHDSLDLDTGIRRLEVRGPGDRQLVSQLRRRLPCWDAEQLAEFVNRADSREKRLHGLALLTALAPQERDDSLAAFVAAGLEDEDPELREAAYGAAVHLHWEQLTRTMSERLGRESDPQLCRTVKQWIAHL